MIENKLLKTKTVNYSIIGYLLIILFASFWLTILTIKYFSFGYYDWDLAVCSSIMWNLSHGSTQLSLMGDLNNFLGNHANIIAFLIAPIYRIFSHPLVLIYLQTISLFSSIFVIYYIAKRELNIYLSLAIILLYLLYPPLWYGLLYEFHFLSLSVGFLTFAYLYFYKNQFTKYLIFITLALICREDVSLVVLGLGVYTLFTKRPLRWKVVTILLGLLWFYLSIFIINAHYAKNQEYNYTFLLENQGKNLPDVIKNIIFNPLSFITRTFFSGKNLGYFTDLFNPLGFLPLTNLNSVIILPYMLLHLIASKSSHQSIYRHYALPMIPFIFIATIYAIKHLTKIKNKPLLNYCKVFLVMCIVYFLFYSIPLKMVMQIYADFRKVYIEGYKALLSVLAPGKNMLPEIDESEIDRLISGGADIYTIDNLKAALLSSEPLPFEECEKLVRTLDIFQDNGTVILEYVSNMSSVVAENLKNHNYHFDNIVLLH